VRGLNADIQEPYQLFNWISRMGERIYYYQAPTGFPDRGKYWINTGALLNRMDFSLALTSGQIPGVKVNLAKFTPGQQPESAQAAIITYSKLLLPEQNPDQTVKELSPLLNDPGLAAKMNNVIQPVKTASPPTPEKPMAGAPGDMMLMSAVTDNKPKPRAQETAKAAYTMAGNKPNTMEVLAAGIIIGSPEFQRR
jgi:hypothetical protein